MTWYSIVIMIVIFANERLATAQYALVWLGIVLKVLDVVYEGDSRAHSVSIISTSEPDLVKVMDTQSTFSQSYEIFIEDLLLFSVPVVCHRSSLKYRFFFWLLEILEFHKRGVVK